MNILRGPGRSCSLHSPGDHDFGARSRLASRTFVRCDLLSQSVLAKSHSNLLVRTLRGPLVVTGPRRVRQHTRIFYMKLITDSLTWMTRRWSRHDSTCIGRLKSHGVGPCCLPAAHCIRAGQNALNVPNRASRRKTPSSAQLRTNQYRKRVDGSMRRNAASHSVFKRQQAPFQLTPAIRHFTKSQEPNAS
jgi:hypothetical protein